MVIYDMFVWEVCVGSVKFVDFSGYFRCLFAKIFFDFLQKNEERPPMKVMCFGCLFWVLFWMLLALLVT